MTAPGTQDYTARIDTYDDTGANVNDLLRYNPPIDLADDDDSRARVLRMVPPATTILELGASVGAMTRFMHAWGMQVTTVEFDSRAAAFLEPISERVIIGDLDDPATLDRVGDRTFDVVLATDVLEHLRDPLRCLTQVARFVKPGGRIILSIPNIAHGNVRIALLLGHFDYRDLGLMDRTHIHFFTRESLMEMMQAAGVTPVRWHRTVREIGFEEIPIPETMVTWAQGVLATDPDAETYQWLVECVVDQSDADTSELSNTSPAEIEQAITRAVTRRR